MPEEITPDTHAAQVTPAHVLDAVNTLRADVTTRLDKLERTVYESGLDGHTPYLKAFLEQYAATYVSRQAWQTVRSDIRHRIRFLAPGKHWLALLLAGILGAAGWQIVNAVTGAHLPPPL